MPQPYDAIIEISDIRDDVEVSCRTAINDRAVEDYAEAIQRGHVMPPVLVYRDGVTTRVAVFSGSDPVVKSTRDVYWLADGFHRLRAAVLAGHTSIKATVRDGTKRDAMLEAVGCNGKNGLRRTNGDKRKAVLRLLRDPEWCEWSNREIATRCDVHEKTVRNLAHLRKSADEATSSRRARRNGTVYTMNTARIGQTPPVTTPVLTDDAPEYMCPLFGCGQEPPASPPCDSVGPPENDDPITFGGAPPMFAGAHDSDRLSQVMSDILSLGEEDRRRVYRWLRDELAALALPEWD
jgi:hypothetical protein